MRSSAVRLFAAGVVLLGAMAGGLAGQTAPRAKPSRPLATVRLAGVEYHDATAFGARFGLVAERSADGRKLSLKSRWSSISLEADTRDNSINGVRVFFGEAVRLHRGTLHLSRLDAEKLITPILLPGSGQATVPAVRTILLDPGHGGSDPGMQNKRLKLDEKVLTLDTALRLRKLLESQGFRVVLTRRDDRQLARSKREDLQTRAALIGEAQADLFISLHFNSVESGADRVTGVEVYSLTPQFQFSHSDPERADGTAGIANLGNQHDHWNSLLAYTLHRELLNGLNAPDRGLKRGRLAVLRLATCPAVLVEAGFLSNDAEAKKIATPAYRQKIAEAIAEGVRVYARRLEGVRRQRATPNREFSPDENITFPVIGLGCQPGPDAVAGLGPRGPPDCQPTRPGRIAGGIPPVLFVNLPRLNASPSSPGSRAAGATIRTCPSGTATVWTITSTSSGWPRRG